MADVGEERRLGPVEFGELFRSAQLGLVFHGTVHQRRGLLGHQAEERLVSLVQGPSGAGGQHDHAGRLVAGPFPQRQHHRLRGRCLPAAGRKLPEPGDHVGQHDRVARAQNRIHWPAAGSAWPRGRFGTRPAALDQGGVPAVRPAQVDGGEGHHLPGPIQGPNDEITCLGDAASLPRLGAQILQRGQPSSADYLLGGVPDRREHAAYGSVVVMQRAVGVGPVCLLPVAVPVHGQQQVLGPGGLPGAQHRIEHRADRVPDLAPDLIAGSSERRVLAAQQRQVRVVIEEAQLLTPPDDHWEPRGQADAAGGAQAGWPVPWITQRRARPRVGAHPPRHLAVARERQLRCAGALAAAHRLGPLLMQAG